MKYFSYGLLAFCILSTLFCKGESQSSRDDFRRCAPRRSSSGRQRSGFRIIGWPGPPPLAMFLAECRGFITDLAMKEHAMKRTREIGSCPAPTDCQKCLWDDVMAIRNNVNDPSETCKNKLLALINGGEGDIGGGGGGGEEEGGEGTGDEEGGTPERGDEEYEY